MLVLGGLVSPQGKLSSLAGSQAPHELRGVGLITVGAPSLAVESLEFGLLADVLQLIANL